MRGRLHLTAHAARKSALRLALLCAPAVAVAAIAAGPAAAAGPCVYPIGITGSGTTATGTFSVVCPGTQVSLVSIVHAANPANDSIFASSTGTFDVGEHSLSVELKCGAATEADLVIGPPALYPPPDRDIRTAAFRIDCPAPPPPGPTPPPNTPPTTTPPTTTSTPPPSSGPDHVGYCDQNNVFQLLTVGQPVPPGWRPADVNPATGAIFCAPPPAAPAAVIASVPTAPKQGVAGAKAKIKHAVKRTVKHVTKPKKPNAILRAKKKGASLPFTK
jgi:hypothetical protein